MLKEGMGQRYGKCGNCCKSRDHAKKEEKEKEEERVQTEGRK